MIFNKTKTSSDAKNATVLQKFYQLFYPKIFNSFQISCLKDGQSALQVNGPGGLFYELRLPDIQSLRDTGTTEVSVRFRISESHPEQCYTLPFKTWLGSKDLPDSIGQAHEVIKQGLGQMGLSVHEALELESDFSAKVIERDNLPDLMFEGKVIASVAAPFRNGRNTVYSVYETKTGKYVGVKTGQSLMPGEHTRHETVVGEDLSVIVGLFGFNFTTKQLYNQLGIQAGERV